MSSGTTPERRRNARGEGDRLRQDLLEAAAELMSTYGDIKSISLRAVARQAGVSPTAVYRHFDDHLDLLRESVEFCWTNFRDAIQAGGETSSDPYLAFRGAGDAYVNFAMRHRGQYRVLFSNRIDLGMDDIAAGANAFQILVDLITEILRTNGDDRDARFVAIQTHTWMHGIVDLAGGQPEMGIPDVSTMLDGLAEALELTES